jgi:hypothetical protein
MVAGTTAAAAGSAMHARAIVDIATVNFVVVFMISFPLLQNDESMRT